MGFSEADVLMCDPFEGDFGEPGDRILNDKMVTARKLGECHLCASTIVPGERVRSRTGVFDGEMCSFRWCNLCCAAMAKYDEDDGEEYERRAEMRDQ